MCVPLYKKRTDEERKRERERDSLAILIGWFDYHFLKLVVF